MSKKLKPGSDGPFTSQRSFALRGKGSPTTICVFESKEGAMGIRIVTERDGKEPFTTQFVLSPKTFAVLSEALFRAAHDPTVWHPAPASSPEGSG